MYAWNGKLMRKGDGGSAIRELQTALTELGFQPGVDGDFGPKTEEAIKSIQKKLGLSDDGIVGKDTAAAINKLFMERAQQAAPSKAGAVPAPGAADAKDGLAGKSDGKGSVSSKGESAAPGAAAKEAVENVRSFADNLFGKKKK